LAPQDAPQETLALQVMLHRSPQSAEQSLVLSWQSSVQSLPQTLPQRSMLWQKNLQPLPSPEQPW
jgi:hypothetical protein